MSGRHETSISLQPFNAMDDDGLCWSALADAWDPSVIAPGVELIAGNASARGGVRVVAVDPDGERRGTRDSYAIAPLRRKCWGVGAAYGSTGVCDVAPGVSGSTGVEGGWVLQPLRMVGEPRAVSGGKSVPL